MQISIERTPIEDVVLIEHQVARDDRGKFVEFYRRDMFAEAGLPADFAQINYSRSALGVVRGLHFQWQPAMAKVMRVVQGRAFLVAVDIRHDSPTLGQWFGIELGPEDHKQVYAPAGFARGFAALSEATEIEYLCTGLYNGAGESGIRWDDPAIGIRWPVAKPQLSPKDRDAKTLAEWLERPESRQFRKG